MNTVLIIDSDARINNTLGEPLALAGFMALAATDGLEGLKAFYNQRPDVVILEPGVADIDGWTVAERIREVSFVPLLALTAIATSEAKLRAFALGVDDYVTKPCSAAETIARMKAVLKRANNSIQSGNVTPKSEVFTAGDLMIDLTARRVTRAGRSISLTPTEFRLLATLARHKSRSLSHEYLLDSVWGREYHGEINHIKRYVWALRKKLEHDPAAPEHIVTERGYGYRFD